MSKPITTQYAQEIAISALTHLANNEELLLRFIKLSGTAPSQFRQSIKDNKFLAGLLEFFITHAPSLINLSDDINVAPEMIVSAHQRLSGQDEPNDNSI